MTQQFTASEVRRTACEWPAWRVGDMLHAYADLLEAQEKAVPVATVRWHSKHGFNWRDVGSGPHGDLHTGWIDVPLYTHPATSDAERLVEALRTIGERLSSVLCDPSGEVVVRGSDGDRQVLTQALKDLGDLTAHSTQAQPPAASVTDAMVERACKRYAFREDGATFPDAYSDEEVLAERTLMREFLEHVLLAEQENPNG